MWPKPGPFDFSAGPGSFHLFVTSNATSATVSAVDGSSVVGRQMGTHSRLAPDCRVGGLTAPEASVGDGRGFGITPGSLSLLSRGWRCAGARSGGKR
jgi:hypothetical protein